MSRASISLDMVPLSDELSQKRDKQSTNSKAKNCAECRRLKIKCDRKIPCHNCLKRGLGSICPDNTLGSRSGRLVLSNTEDLHAKIEELTMRIQDLEAALAVLQAEVSTEPHPLLSHNQITAKSRSLTDPKNATINTYGSLMTNDDGSSYFFGATTASDLVITTSEEAAPNPETLPPWGDSNNLIPVVPDLFLSYDTFVDRSLALPTDHTALCEILFQSLPDKVKAMEAVNAYFAESWELNPVPRARFMEDFFLPCYDDPQNTPERRRAVALIYAVLSLGTLSDPSGPNIARRYITLSRAALLVDDMISRPTTTTIDILLLHWTFLRLRGGHDGIERIWLMIGTIIRLAQALGLHRDPSLWDLPPKEALHRRRTMALHFGRPPCLSQQHFDVQFPFDDSDKSEAIPDFILGKYLFTQKCLWPILDVALAAKDRTTYGAILRVDKMIRDWTLPYQMQTTTPLPREDQKITFDTQGTMIFIVREAALLSLHKSYFAAAMFQPPYEALRGQYSRSVLAAYASACAILVRVRAYHASYPRLFEKFAVFGLHSFDAAILLGTMVATLPDCLLSTSAMVEFDKSASMFLSSTRTLRSRRRVPIIKKLQAKAHAVLDSYRAGTWINPRIQTKENQDRQQGEQSPHVNLDHDLQTVLGGKAVVRPRHESPASGLDVDRNPSSPNLNRASSSLSGHSGSSPSGPSAAHSPSIHSPGPSPPSIVPSTETVVNTTSGMMAQGPAQAQSHTQTQPGPTPPFNLTTDMASLPDADFEEFLEGYLKSFEGIDTSFLTSFSDIPGDGYSGRNEAQASSQSSFNPNPVVSSLTPPNLANILTQSDYPSNSSSPMHVLSSDAFLHSAFTGDWSAYPMDPSSIFGFPAPTYTVHTAYNQPDHSNHPMYLTAPMQSMPSLNSSGNLSGTMQDVGQWEGITSSLSVPMASSGGGSSHGSLIPEPSMESWSSQPQTQISGQIQPFAAGLEELNISHLSQTQFPPPGSENNALDSTHWEEFLNSLGGDGGAGI